MAAAGGSGSVTSRASLRLKALVVDDEQDTLDFVDRTLRGHFEVVSTTSGETALGLLDDQEFSCVITDQRMPGSIQGTDVLGRAAQLVPQSVRVLMTGYADSEAIIDAINRGHTSAFLKKPFTGQELSATIERAADFHRLSVKYSRAMSELEGKTRELEQLALELERQKHLLTLTADRRSMELAAVVEQLRGMVFRDALTGLYNHRYFQERLSQEVERALRHGVELSLLFIDIDHFKTYNDRLGHPAGDEALRVVAGLLTRGLEPEAAFQEIPELSAAEATVAAEAVPPGGSTEETPLPRLRRTDIAARYGGEEFVVILPETGAQAARVVADRIRHHVEMVSLPGIEQQPDGRLTVSLGIATVPGHASSKTQLISRADQALFAAKRAGRNQIVTYDASLDAWDF